jgi:hypothetical protein
MGEGLGFWVWGVGLGSVTVVNDVVVYSSKVQTAIADGRAGHAASGMREVFKKLKGKTFSVHNKQMQMTVEEDPYLNGSASLSRVPSP